MMSLHNSTHSSQMYTEGPAMSFRTSFWDLPQKLQQVLGCLLLLDLRLTRSSERSVRR